MTKSLQSPVIIKRNQLHSFLNKFVLNVLLFFHFLFKMCIYLKKKKKTSAEQREVSCQQTGLLRRVNKECFSEVETEVVIGTFIASNTFYVCACVLQFAGKRSHMKAMHALSCVWRGGQKKKTTANWVIGIPVAIAMAMMGLTSSYREAVKVTPKVLSQAACSVFQCALSSKQY